MDAGHPFDTVAGSACKRMASMHALAIELTRMVRLAGALAQAGREIDLTGLERRVGLLCAQSLDLEPAAGRDMCPKLVELRQAIDTLAGSILARHPLPSD